MLSSSFLLISPRLRGARLSGGARKLPTMAFIAPSAWQPVKRPQASSRARSRADILSGQPYSRSRLWAAACESNPQPPGRQVARFVRRKRAHGFIGHLAPGRWPAPSRPFQACLRLGYIIKSARSRKRSNLAYKQNNCCLRLAPRLTRRLVPCFLVPAEVDSSKSARYFFIIPSRNVYSIRPLAKPKPLRPKCAKRRSSHAIVTTCESFDRTHASRTGFSAGIWSVASSPATGLLAAGRISPRRSAGTGRRRALRGKGLRVSSLSRHERQVSPPPSPGPRADPFFFTSTYPRCSRPRQV